MAKRGYELEKQASLKPTYGIYTPLNMQNRCAIDFHTVYSVFVRCSSYSMFSRRMKPTTSVRSMPAQPNNQRETVRRWIPAEVWQKQGMSAQEMTLPLGETYFGVLKKYVLIVKCFKIWNILHD